MRGISHCLPLVAAFSLMGTALAFHTVSRIPVRQISPRFMARRSATAKHKSKRRRNNSHKFFKRRKFVKHGRVGDFWEARMDVWRPSLADVERISQGKPALHKGTGSRGVPHRLTLDERFLLDRARKKGFLELETTEDEMNSDASSAPLLNAYRSLCDARGQASIVLHRGIYAGPNEVVCDLSPLRNPDTFDRVAQKCIELRDGGDVVFEGSHGGAEEDWLTEYYEDHDEDHDENSQQQHEASSSEDLFMTLSIVDQAIRKSKMTAPDGSHGLGPWETRPIYQLPPYCISWELESHREAQKLGTRLARVFSTAERAPSSKQQQQQQQQHKPIRVHKAGKSGRRKSP